MIMSDAYKEYCEERQIVDRMRKTMIGVEKWKSMTDSQKIEICQEIRRIVIEYYDRISSDITKMNLGYAKDDLLSMKCGILNKLEEIGIV